MSHTQTYNRNPYSSLNRRDRPAGSLFENYPGNTSTDNKSRPSSSRSPQPAYGGYGRASPYDQSDGSPYMNGTGTASSSQQSNSNSGFRPATPDRRGNFSTSVLDSLESQNENDSTSVLLGKVSQLKQLSSLIGEEIRDSSALADKMNEGFERTGARLKGTMRRMLRMAERTGVGWKVWVVFFVAVWALFAWVWLF